MLLAMVSVCLTLTKEREVDPRVPPHLPIEHFTSEDERRDGRRRRETVEKERETAIVIYAEVSEQLRWLCKILLIPVSEILSRSDTALRFVGTPSFFSLLLCSFSFFFFFSSTIFLFLCSSSSPSSSSCSCSSLSSLAPLKGIVVRHAETHCARTTLLSKFRQSTPKKAYKHVICWWNEFLSMSKREREREGRALWKCWTFTKLELPLILFVIDTVSPDLRSTIRFWNGKRRRYKIQEQAMAIHVSISPFKSCLIYIIIRQIFSEFSIIYLRTVCRHGFFRHIFSNVEACSIDCKLRWHRIAKVSVTVGPRIQVRVLANV